jgi:hypothetical protein
MLLRARASLRQLIAKIRRPKGAVMAAFVVIMLAVVVVPGMLLSSPTLSRGVPRAAVTSSPAGPAGPAAPAVPDEAPSLVTEAPVKIRGFQEFLDGVEFAPLLIVALLLLSIAGTPADRVLAFSPAEVDLLFPAPFTRRQLLLYSMAKWVLPLLWVSLFLSLFMVRFGGSWLATWLGLLLLMSFMNLATLNAALIQQRIGQPRFRILRRALYLLALLSAVGASWWAQSHSTAGTIGGVKDAIESPAMRLVALPGVPFVRMIGASSLAEALAPWGLVVLAMNSALFALALLLDSNWLEQGADSSARVAAKLAQLRQRGGLGAARARFAAITLPMPPRLGGLGPMAWRQLVCGLRQAAGSIVLICLVLTASLVPLATILRQSEAAMQTARVVVFIAIGYISLFAPTMLRMDFRGDIDRLPLLKSLPLSALTVALAQVLPCVLLVTVVQAALAAVALWLFQIQVPALPMWLLVLFAFNTVMVGFENSAFLFWPHRPRGGPGLNLSGAQVVIHMLKFMALGACLAFAAGGALLAALTIGDPIRLWAAAAGALFVLSVEALLILLVVAAQFRRLDPDLERLADA